MNIADNPISKPYLGGIIVAMLTYLEIRISDTLGWPQGMLYKLDLQYSRGVAHMYAGSICDCGLEIFSKVNDQAMTFP